MSSVELPDFSEELKQFSSTLIGEITANMLRNGQNVTGKTLKSIEDTHTKTGFTILANKYIMSLDTGRGPSKGPAGQPTLKEAILAWIYAKGIKPMGNKDGTVKDYHYRGLAYIIAQRIHIEGNWIYRNSKPTGIITKVLTEPRIEAFIGVFSNKFLSYVKSEILAELNK